MYLIDRKINEIVQGDVDIFIISVSIENTDNISQSTCMYVCMYVCMYTVYLFHFNTLLLILLNVYV